MFYILESIIANMSNIIWTLVGAGILALCKVLIEKVKDIKAMVDDRNDEAIIALIKEEIQPIMESVKLLNESFDLFQEQEAQSMETLRELHKFELVRLCISYLGYGFMTMEEYNYLIDFYALYKELGGNGQGDAYYEKAIKLPIKDRHWKDKKI